MKIHEKLLHASLILGILSLSCLPPAQAWPNPNKAIKDAKKAGKKASKKASKAGKKAQKSAQKQVKNATKSAPKKMVGQNRYVDVCRTPAPPVKGGVPVPYPNTKKMQKDLNKAGIKASKVKVNTKAATRNAKKAGKRQYRNARTTKKQVESAVKGSGFPNTCKTPTPAGPVPIPYPNVGKIKKRSSK